VKVQVHRVNLLELQNGILPSDPNFPNSIATLLLVFAPAGYEFNNFNDLIHYLRNYSGCFIAGCSSGGVVYDNQIFDDEMVILMMSMERTHLHVCSANHTNRDSYQVGVQIASTLVSPGFAGALVFSGGEITSGTQFAAGVNSVIKGTVPVVGALAGKVDPEAWTWILDGTKIIATAAVGIGFYGTDFKLMAAHVSNWECEGLWVEVTAAEGREIFEINNRPALDVYSHYIGAIEAASLPASAFRHPIAILPKIMGMDKTVCMVYDIDKAKKSLKVVTEIPTKSIIQFMKTTVPQLMRGVEDVAVLLASAIDDDNPGATILISSVGRRSVLSAADTLSEVQKMQEHLSTTTFVGLYSIGEFCPYVSDNTDFFNQSATLVNLSERL
jgi:hypothetical protein